MANKFGVILAADMTRNADRCLRIAEEARHHVASGAKVGLLQHCEPGPRIAPEVQACIRRGLAEVVDASVDVGADLLIVHGPSDIDWRKKRLSKVNASQTIVVCYASGDFAVAGLRRRAANGGEVSWAPVSASIRESAPPGLTLTNNDWLPLVQRADIVSRTRLCARAETVQIGWISEEPAPPSDLETQVVALDDRMLFDLSLDRLLGLDAIACFPTMQRNDLPYTIIRAALQHSVPVALPIWAEEQFGRGPIYCEVGDAPDRLRAARRERALHAVDKVPAAPQAASDMSRPIMFVASNGVGIGHVSRLLAIARRIDKQRPIVFVTQAQAVGAIERLGYRAEYLPSAHYVGGDFAQWDRWFRFELEMLIEAYDPGLVVYDGNNPSDGLVRAVTSRRDCRLAWIRRGLWGALTSPFVGNSLWFDLIIEPGELEGQPDKGITAQRRSEATRVAPVRLLEDDEILSRSEAAAALSLDPTRPAALIQLGAGYNRDVITLIDRLVGALRQAPQLQICIAEWVNGAQQIRYWPDVTYLRGYPFSQYFRAFDFSIAAAGYNTFHEVLAFGLPTIFIPNRHPSMDDQTGRAEHAQSLQAAFELSEDELEDLPDLVTLLMDAKARDFLVANGTKLKQENGNAAAAAALAGLMEVRA